MPTCSLTCIHVVSHALPLACQPGVSQVLSFGANQLLLISSYRRRRFFCLSARKSSVMTEMRAGRCMQPASFPSIADGHGLLLALHECLHIVNQLAMHVILCGRHVGGSYTCVVADMQTASISLHQTVDSACILLKNEGICRNNILTKSQLPRLCIAVHAT